MLDLHDKMEAGGLHGAVGLMEQLFNVKPGEDKKLKKKLKDKIRKGMRSRVVVSNTKSNSMIDPKVVLATPSEEMIYEKAVVQKRASSSSEDGLDLSDESNLFNRLILGETCRGDKDAVAVTSTSKPPDRTAQPDMGLEEIGDNNVRLAEKAKAAMYPPKGEQNLNNFDLIQLQKTNNFNKDLSLIDQDYIVVSGHVDSLLQQKIAQGDYVDFSKLLPKDKILVEEDDRMELVVCNGKAYWTPVTEGVSISGFSKWEQAFRVFANIYTRTHPDRAGQLIEYNHIIHLIAQSFV